MKARYARWFSGQGCLSSREAEPIWLTFEGSGQWVAYRWEVDPRGGGVKPDAILDRIRQRQHWWTQREGFAAFMALERLAGTRGSGRRFIFGQQDVLQMLDEAAARYPDSKSA